MLHQFKRRNFSGKIFFLILIPICFFIQCQKEFDPTGEWQESYAAYCLLDLKDTVQYVRVNRVFLSPDDPAHYLQEPDSVHIDPEIMEVSLIYLKDGTPEGDPVIFVPTSEFLKEEGLFATQDYFVFKSAVLLKADRKYRLLIRNRETGFVMQAETDLLGNRPLGYSFLETRYYNINQYTAEMIDYDGPLNTNQFDKRVIRILYYEYRGEEKKMMYLDWRPSYNKSASFPALDTAQLSDDLLRYIGENIPVDPGVKRKAVGVDKMLIINDELTNLYIGYYQNIISGQFIPDLTNFDKGKGIFASRYHYTFFAMSLKPETLDTLAYGRFTKELGFSDGSGNWPPPK